MGLWPVRLSSSLSVRQSSDLLYVKTIGVNFYKAARLEPPHFSNS